MMTVLQVIVQISIYAVMFLAGVRCVAKRYLEAVKEYDEIIEKYKGTIEEYKELVNKQNDQIERLIALVVRLMIGGQTHEPRAETESKEE